MTPTSLLLFAATEFFLSLSPGPAVFFVVAQGLQRGKKASLFAALGILTGNGIYFALSAVGVGAILLTSQVAFLLIKWLGVAYLTYLGIKLIYTSFLSDSLEPEIDHLETKRRLSFRQGLLMQLANPQSILFFVAILPQFVDIELAPAGQLLVLGIISIFLELPILLAYGWMADRGGALFKNSRFFKWLDVVAGTFLLGAGVKLALWSQE